MPDLRKYFNDPDYYKNIRKKRVTPAQGTIQKLSKKARKEMSQKGHAARWFKDKEVEDIEEPKGE